MPESLTLDIFWYFWIHTFEVNFMLKLFSFPLKWKRMSFTKRCYFNYDLQASMKKIFGFPTRTCMSHTLNMNSSTCTWLLKGRSNMKHWHPLSVQTSVTRDSIFHVLFPSVSRRKLSAVPWLQKENNFVKCIDNVRARVKIPWPYDEHEKTICISMQFLLCHLSMESLYDCSLPCFVQEVPTFSPNSSLDLSSCGEYLLQNL